MRVHHKLVVWQNARKLVKEAYQMTRSFPKEEMFSLTQQIKRASVSIPANISEGTGRKTKKRQSRFLTIAHGSAFELETLFIISCELEFIAEDSLIKLLEKTEMITVQLNGLLNKYQTD
ncbi:MAG: four helix bundle protein [Bacteroidetes bacterium]|nr:four helix bundle protein [Bacteroidota bacterium]